MDYSPLLLTLKLATATTVVLMVLGIAIAWGLSVCKSKIKPILEAIISLPLVLPPTVLGFYFLLAFNPDSFLGSWLINSLGINILFSFPGLVLASVIYSLPFMVQPIQAGLTNLPKKYVHAAQVMGKSTFITFFKVQLPNIKPSILTAIVLSFAHTIGEFGVVLMIGGNIPNQTRVASIAIYDQVEALNYNEANNYAMVLIAVSFLTLLVVYSLNGGLFKSNKL